MSEEQTLTYDAGTETVTTEENLTPDEQDSLQIGEQMETQEETLLAGKYKNAEELEKAHIELQKKLGEKSDKDSEEVETTDEKVEEKEDSKEESESNILDQLWEEGSNNKINEETIKNISKMHPVEVAKLAMKQRQAESNNATREFTEQDVQQIHGLVGGQENYNNMMSWAQQNVSEQEVNMYDDVMELGNPLAAYFAVQAMALKYQDSAGKDGQMITGKAPKSTADVFKSQAEMIKAMEDDRYNDDPAYREEILQKLERSNINF
tara:strand:- start:16 stop:810 length:795 start_codon:yes stop_codon:yes gene_type:complete